MKRVMTSRLILLLFSVAGFIGPVSAQPLSVQLANTVMSIWKDSMALKPGRPAEWTYDQGLILKSLEGVWKHTGDPVYFNYIKKSIDFFLREDGTIRTYKLEDYNIDNINPGRNLLMLQGVIKDNKKYLKAASLLKEQLNYHPRTNEGGFWHKKRYPYQMWLDGLYMAEPFYAEYATRFNQPDAFEDIANQFIWMEKHARDSKTGLLYHGWDESRKEKWADKTTGCSPNFWGRAMGWYAMALVDVLDYMPEGKGKRDSLIQIFKRLSMAITKVQDRKTGLWWQVLDKGDTPGNYLESSASCMFVYALAKGVRMNYLDPSYLKSAEKAFGGIRKQFISVDSNGRTNLNRVCQVAGLGGNPYRDGSFNYYVHEPIISNDPKGLGAAILASVEMEMAADRKIGNGRKVLLDSYFNNERKKDEITGLMIPHHYKWEETLDGGFSFLGEIMRNYGLQTKTLYEAPTPDKLKEASVYIIVDPDYPKENPQPHYIEDKHIDVITDWVKAGGVLVMMMNDTGNVEFDHSNQLANRFGIRFNKDSRNRVEGNDYAVGALEAPATFCSKAKKIYLKQICTLTLNSPAKPILTDKGDVIMAVSRLGKGTVFAVGDPWLYNEYTDGRKIPAEYQNYVAAQEWVQWLIKQVPKRK